MQDACCAEELKLSSPVFKVIQTATADEAARKEKASLERSSAHMIRDMGKLCTKMDNATLAVQLTELMVIQLKAQVKVLIGVI